MGNIVRMVPLWLSRTLHVVKIPHNLKCPLTPKLIFFSCERP